MQTQSFYRMASIEGVVVRADGHRSRQILLAYWHRNPLKRLLGRFRIALDWLRLYPELGATVFTNAGKAIVTNRIIGSGTQPNYVAWGTGAGTAAVGDTTLFTEAPEARVAGTSSRVTTTVTNDTYQVVGTMTASAARTITNAGLFDAATGGSLLMKGDFTGVALASGDSIQFTMKLQFT